MLCDGAECLAKCCMTERCSARSQVLAGLKKQCRTWAGRMRHAAALRVSLKLDPGDIFSDSMRPVGSEKFWTAFNEHGPHFILPDPVMGHSLRTGNESSLILGREAVYLQVRIQPRRLARAHEPAFHVITGVPVPSNLYDVAPPPLKLGNPVPHRQRCREPETVRWKSVPAKSTYDPNRAWTPAECSMPDWEREIKVARHRDRCLAKSEACRQRMMDFKQALRTQIERFPSGNPSSRRERLGEYNGLGMPLKVPARLPTVRYTVLALLLFPRFSR